MTIRPSFEERCQSSEFWAAIETLFDNAAVPNWLPRRDTDALLKWYVRQRAGDPQELLPTFLSRLPAALKNLELGQADIEVIDVLVNRRPGISLSIVGGPGCGKSTLLHFVEAVLNRHFTPTSFVLWNGNKIQRTPGTNEVFRWLAMELQTHTSWGGLLEEFGLQLAEDPSFSRLRKVALRLSDKLSADDKARIVFVFDNLDQHSRQTIDLVSEIAKQLSLVAGFSSLLTMREPTYEGIKGRGSASALFSYNIRLKPPAVDAWLRKLGQRAAELAPTDSTAPRAYGKPITALELRKAFDALAVLMCEKRAEDDDALGAMDAASANNVRQMILLMRRILSNRKLPGRYLCGFEAKQPGFHPLTAMFEGSRIVFKGDNQVPNLLWFRTAQGFDEFTLRQRVLAILDTY